MSELGTRIIDLADVIDQFEAQEGEVQQIIGKTGQGKTYEGTRRAAQFLFSGYTVYTTWKLHLPDYYDEREHIFTVLRNLLFFRKEFFRFDLKNNYHYVDLRQYEKPDGSFDTERFSRFLASLTDCIFMLDEGQDVFDSHTKAGRIARQTITRTRHMHKTLIIISQRAQAVDVTARGNVTYFYKCEKSYVPFFGYRFKVFRTDEIDEGSNYPLWVRHDSTGREVWKAELWHSGFAKQWVYDMYDSWYMRQQQIRSQDIKLDAFELQWRDKLRLLWRVVIPKKRREVKVNEPRRVMIESDETGANFIPIVVAHARALAITHAAKHISRRGGSRALVRKNPRKLKKNTITSDSVGVLLILFFLALPSLSYADSISLTSYDDSNPSNVISIDPGHGFMTFNLAGDQGWNSNCNAIGGACSDIPTSTVYSSNVVNDQTDQFGNFHLLFFNSADDFTSCYNTNAGNADYTDCLPFASQDILITYVPSSGYQNSLQRIVDQATTTFDSTTDPPLTTFLGWAVQNIYLLFLGSGLAVLFILRGWIVAIVMVTAVIYFAYRLFKFFRH